MTVTALSLPMKQKLNGEVPGRTSELVKVSLFTLSTHTGAVMYKFYSFLTSALELCGQLHAPVALRPGKEAPLSIWPRLDV
jgi:hypothetical protein